MSLGTVEWPGVVLPIRSIALRYGMFVIHARDYGPIGAYRGPISVYGPDRVEVGNAGSWADTSGAAEGVVLNLFVECGQDVPAGPPEDAR